MRKFVIGAATAAALVGGSVAVAAVNPLGIAGAQSDPGTTVAPTPTPSAPADPGAKPGGPGHHGRPGVGGGALEKTLEELVANGTITQAQADAIKDGVRSKLEAGKGEHPGGPGGPGGMGGRAFGMHVVETAAKAIGIDAKTLLTEAKGGKSIAEVATAHGVDPQVVIDALVTSMNAQIDKAVADGKLPAARAATMKEKVPERAKKLVEATPGHGPFGKGKGPGRPDEMPAEPPAEPPADAPPSTDAPSTSEAPTTEAPTTQAPTTQAPTTQAPTTEAPTPPGTTGS